MRNEKLKAVLFDLDGTLIDTADEFVVVVQKLRAEHGMTAMDPTRIRASVSNGARALVSLGLGLDPSDDIFESKRLRLLELYSEVLATEAKPYPGISSLLDELAKRNIAWGVATNKPRAYAAPLMERIDLPPCPSLVCPDDVKDRKPHPESLYRNCRDLDCAPHEAIYVGDHLRDIEAGKRAGMFTIAAAYGYIEPDDEPAQWGADALVNNSTELCELIFNL
ncbi:MAG: HAD-IA family hydrolase [Halioglobus sp.]